jgi:hypothetical protein
MNSEYEFIVATPAIFIGGGVQIDGTSNAPG